MLYNGVFQNDTVGIPILLFQNDNNVKNFLENVPNLQRCFQAYEIWNTSLKNFYIVVVLTLYDWNFYDVVLGYFYVQKYFFNKISTFSIIILFTTLKVHSSMFFGILFSHVVSTQSFDYVEMTSVSCFFGKTRSENGTQKSFFA